MLDGPAGAEPGPGGPRGPAAARVEGGPQRPGLFPRPLPGDKASPRGLLPRAKRVLRLAPAFFFFLSVLLLLYFVFNSAEFLKLV